MKLNKIDELWRCANSLFKWRFRFVVDFSPRLFSWFRRFLPKDQPLSQGSLLPALGCRKVYFRSLTWWLNSRLSNHAYDVGYKFDKHGWRKVGNMTFLPQVLQLKLRRKMSLLLLYTFLKCWILFLFIAEVLVGGARGVRNSLQVFAIRSVCCRVALMMFFINPPLPLGCEFLTLHEVKTVT